MPVFQIGLDDGRTLRIEADDQAAALAGVQHFQENEKPTAPSGIEAGAAHGLANVAGGLSSTLGLAGGKSDTLDALAAAAEPKDYKAAPLIREGGHWYNPSDWQPSNAPQALAEMAPGLATDWAVGKAGAKLGGAAAGPRGALIGGLGGFAGSMAARTFGYGAHENADARTGVPNSPVTGRDILTEAGKQAVTAPLAMIPASRILPGSSKLAGSALQKYAGTVGDTAAASFLGDAANQFGTTVGSKDGLSYDANRGATAAATGALGSAALASPRLAADANAALANRPYEVNPETKAAATVVANRIKQAADGRDLVGPLGGTKTAEEVHAKVNAAVHSELADAVKSEDNLSQDSTNTLADVQAGRKVSPKELTALAAEADPKTVDLARQALISSQLKATGGLSGAMDNLPPIKHPVNTLLAAGGAAAVPGIGHALSAVSIPALGALYGTYGAARAFDKMSGMRAPIQGFMERNADPSVPIRTPEAPVAPPPVDPYNPSAGPWGARTPEGPTGPTVAPPSAPEAPGIDPNALNTQARAALQMYAARRKFDAQNAKQLAAQNKPVDLPAKFAGTLGKDPVELPPTFAGSMLGKVMPKMAEPAAVSDAPASPEIGALMQKLDGQSAAPAAPPAAPAAPPAAPAPAPAAPYSGPDLGPLQPSTPAAPEPSMIAKITKKLNGAVQETPHPAPPEQEHVDPTTGEVFNYTALTKEQLYGRNMSHEEFARHEADAEIAKGNLKPENRDVYETGVIMDRLKRERELQALSQHAEAPDDVPVAKLLLQELHHTRRGETAERAVKFAGTLMSPKMRAHAAKLMKGPFHQMWDKVDL